MVVFGVAALRCAGGVGGAGAALLPLLLVCLSEEIVDFTLQGGQLILHLCRCSLALRQIFESLEYK